MVVGRFEEDLGAWHVMLEVEGIDVMGFHATNQLSSPEVSPPQTSPISRKRGKASRLHSSPQFGSAWLAHSERCPSRFRCSSPFVSEGQ